MMANGAREEQRQRRGITPGPHTIAGALLDDDLVRNRTVPRDRRTETEVRIPLLGFVEEAAARAESLDVMTCETSELHSSFYRYFRLIDHVVIVQ